MKIKIGKDKLISLLVVVLIGVLLMMRYIDIKVSDDNIEVVPLVTEPVEEHIKAHISGEVKKPGVYELEAGQRVDDLVQLAGGLTSEADESKINLAKIVRDEDKVVIYAKEERTEYRGLDVLLYGDKETLLAVDGIGEVTADKILAYREDNIISSFDDLLNIEGIGEGKLKNIQKALE